MVACEIVARFNCEPLPYVPGQLAACADSVQTIRLHRCDRTVSTASEDIALPHPFSMSFRLNAC